MFDIIIYELIRMILMSNVNLKTKYFAHSRNVLYSDAQVETKDND